MLNFIGVAISAHVNNLVSEQEDPRGKGARLSQAQVDLFAQGRKHRLAAAEDHRVDDRPKLLYRISSRSCAWGIENF